MGLRCDWWIPTSRLPELLVQELYDHRSDPEEEDNLAAREPEVVKRLEALVAERPSVKR